MNRVPVTVGHQKHVLDADQVIRELERVMPEPVEEHFVVISGRRYPPKQAVSVLTGLDRADFNTHQARRILSRLGFVVGRRSREIAPASPERPGPHRGREADLLRPFAGLWVAQRGLEVMIAAETPQDILQWLERNNQRADAMFRVPCDEWEAGGLAPA